MALQFSAIESIKERSSRRSYVSRDIPGDIEQEIGSILNSLPTPPFGNSARFELVKRDSPGKEKLKLGTYGFISGAKYFIVGAAGPAEKNLEDFGFQMEYLVLYMTGLGLATCWLGGTLNRSEFGIALDIKEDEIVPAVTPLGYATEKRGIKDRVIRGMAGSKNRKPRRVLFFKNDFSTPLEDGEAGVYDLPLEMLRLAPSASNRQPWRILQLDGDFHFFLERGTKNGKPGWAVDLPRIDMGIAMCHFELSARELDIKGKWEGKQPGNFVPRGKEYIASWRPLP